MIFKTRISSIFSQPHHHGDHFTAPIGFQFGGEEQFWSAKVAWGEGDGSEGDIVEISMLSPDAPRISSGQTIRIMKGNETICESIIE